MSLRGNELYEEALPFDYIRSTFIGIIDCFENNFNNFFPEKLNIDIIENYSYSGKSFRGKYFGFYHHNLLDNNIISNFNSRINRLIKMLTNNKDKFIFVRTIVSHNYNDELELSEKFLNIIKLKYNLNNFILIFIIPGQNTTQYYKNINNKCFIFTLNDTSENNYNLSIEYKPIYDYILNNDLFNKIPNINNINIQNGYNRFAEVDGISIIKI